MSNPLAEVSFESRGKTYTFMMGTYAQVILERKTKTTMSKVFERASSGDWGVDDMLTVFYAGLYRQHQLTEEQVADIMDDLGIEKVGELFKQAFEIANPKAGGEGQSNDDPLPPAKAKPKQIGQQH